MRDALIDLWRAQVPDLNYMVGDSESGIFKFWAGLEGFESHWNQLGSPVGREHGDGDSVYQAFANGIIEWAPDGPKVITE